MGITFDESTLIGWLMGGLVFLLGCLVIAVAVRWRRRGSLTAALAWKEATP
jgi:uncharacterized membrane protein